MGRENGPDMSAFSRGAEAGQGFDQRQIGLTNAMMIQALALSDVHGTAIEPVGEGVDERALTDAGLACHEHDLALARQRQAEALFEVRHFGPPPDQPRPSGWMRERCCGKLGGVAHRRHRHHQSIATPMPCLDIARAARVVAERLSQFLDAGGERVVADRKAAPDLVEQLPLGDELLGAFGQHCEQGGGPRRELGLQPVTPELAGARVEPEPAERELPIRHHRGPPKHFPEKSRNSAGTCRT